MHAKALPVTEYEKQRRWLRRNLRFTVSALGIVGVEGPGAWMLARRLNEPDYVPPAPETCTAA